MVGSGTALLVLSIAAGWLTWRHRRVPDGKWFLRALVAAGPFGFLAIEAGWTVTELGRQPWIIYGVMRTEEAVTPMGRIFIRNVAMLFDSYLETKSPEAPKVFSRTL